MHYIQFLIIKNYISHSNRTREEICHLEGFSFTFIHFVEAFLSVLLMGYIREKMRKSIRKNECKKLHVLYSTVFWTLWVRRLFHGPAELKGSSWGFLLCGVVTIKTWISKELLNWLRCRWGLKLCTWYRQPSETSAEILTVKGSSKMEEHRSEILHKGGDWVQKNSFLVSGAADLVVVGCGFSLSAALCEGHTRLLKMICIYKVNKKKLIRKGTVISQNVSLQGNSHYYSNANVADFDRYVYK